MVDNNLFFMLCDELFVVYRKMCIICEFEEWLYIDFGCGDILGFVYFYVGEEVMVIGIMFYLGDGDWIVSMYCGYGYCIVKGVDVIGMMKEIYGKKGGFCNGKGGLMYIVDLSKGMMGVNGIFGVGVFLICGVVLVVKFCGKGEVGIIFIGDGVCNQGIFLESMNLVVVWNFFVIFVVENNGYVEVILCDYGIVVESFVDCVVGFGMFGVSIDGIDLFVVYEVVGEMIKCVWQGGGFVLFECKMVCFYGYFEGDVQIYWVLGEFDDICENYDCIKIFMVQLIKFGVVSVDEIVVIDWEVIELIEMVVKEVKVVLQLIFVDLISDVYVNY